MVNTGDYLVMPVSPDSVQVYRIGKREFEMTFMKDNGPTMLDVLCERGGRSNHHPGNKEYVKLIRNMAHLYPEELNKKGDFTQSIVRKVKGWGGRFMKRKDKSNEWFEVDDEFAKKKVGQLLRDMRKPVKPKPSKLEPYPWQDPPEWVVKIGDVDLYEMDQFLQDSNLYEN